MNGWIWKLPVSMGERLLYMLKRRMGEERSE
jgi:hypothetical protein